MITIVLPGEYTDFNTYSDAERKHRMAAAEIKRTDTESAWIDTKSQINKHGLTIEKYPARFHFHWYKTNKKLDPDNIAFAKKFIMDGFQDADLIGNDGWKHVAGFADSFHIDKDNPRVEVVITW